jgi:hypothetical protein
MPAASAKKRARQRANKLLRTETGTATLSNALRPTQPSEITSESLSTSSPTSFTISYTPVAISYPEPANSTAQLPTDAIRVTRDQLADMLHQSYVHGSEHGWKRHFEAAKEHLQAAYEQDMQDAAAALAENEREIREEAYDRGFESGSDGCEAQLASLQESLTAKYDMQHIKTVLNTSERCQEYHEEGIREERERWESARASLRLVNVATQIDSVTTSVSIQTDHAVAFEPTTATASIQTTSPIIPLPSTASISIQTDTSSPAIPLSDPLPVDIPEPSSTVLTPFNWANDTYSPPTIPLIPPKWSRDISCLRSSTKNPFSSLRRRHQSHHQQKCSKTFYPHRYTQSYPTHPPLRHNPLDWHSDPRLFELSRVLRSLGWSHP